MSEGSEGLFSLGGLRRRVSERIWLREHASVVWNSQKVGSRNQTPDSYTPCIEGLFVLGLSGFHDVSPTDIATASTNKRMARASAARFLGGGGGERAKKEITSMRGQKKLSMSAAMGREDGWVDRAWFLLPFISLSHSPSLFPLSLLLISKVSSSDRREGGSKGGARDSLPPMRQCPSQILFQIT